MIWILAVCTMLFLAVGYILFAPFYLEIDSDRKLIRIRLHHLISARLVTKENTLAICFKIAGHRTYIDLLNPERKRKQQVKPKEKKRVRRISFTKAKAIIKTFKINKCYCNLDFDDVEFNGKLYPLFLWLGYLTGRHFSINFLGENNVCLEIRNNMARIIWAYIFK